MRKRSVDAGFVPQAYKDMLLKFDDGGPYAFGPIPKADARRIKAAIERYRTVFYEWSQKGDNEARVMFEITDRLTMHLQESDDLAYIMFDNNAALKGIELMKKEGTW